MRVHLAAGLAVMFMAMSAFGHHSMKALYDENQTIMLTGMVTRVDWMNPHVHVFMNVKDGDAKGSWELELSSPQGLLSQGWKVDSLKKGSYISISGYPARDGSRMANVRKVTLTAQ